jgi:hypothetical protein
VFTPADLDDLGSRTAVASALTRKNKAGQVRQVSRGIYQSLPGPEAAWPSVEEIVAAVQSRHSIRVQPTGAYAANALGLSDQVPMRVTFLTDGVVRTIKLGRATITFRRTTPRNMATAGRASGLVIQALRWLGREHVTGAHVRTLRKKLSDADKRQLLADRRHAPAWIAEWMARVAAEHD